MIEHVIEAMVDAVLVVDVEGRISRTNTAAAHITGYTPEELRAMPVTKVLHDDNSGLRSVVRHRIEEGAVLRREESWLLARDGTRIPISLTGSPVLTPDGQLQGIVLVARDIRELQSLLAARRRAENELRALNATIESQLEQARSSLLVAERRATLGTLAGGVGHELRNIAQIQIAAVDELAYALAANNDVTELARMLLPDLERVGEHITTHATRLMQLARPEPERVEQLDLNLIVRDVISMLRGAAKLGRLDIELALTSDPLSITVNQVRIEQVLFNLVVNAVDAIGEAPGAITVTTADERDRAVCKVRDTGAGMAPETLARIFEPLFTTKGSKGTGYGLPVAREIVESYGGTLTVESELGAGTTFTFDLPR